MLNELAEVLAKSIELLEECNIEYFVFGAIASDIWGYPRFTIDVDLVLRIKDKDFEKFLDEAKEKGFEVDKKLHLEKLKKSRVVKLKYKDYSCDFVIGETFFDKSAFKRKKKIKIFDKEVFIVSPEDLILYKLIPKRYIDLADIERIIISQRETIDLNYLKNMAKRLSAALDMPHIEKLLDNFLMSFNKRCQFLTLDK